MIVPGNPEYDAEMEAIAHGRRFRMVTNPVERTSPPRMPAHSLIHPLGAQRKLSSEQVCRMCERPWVWKRVRTRHHLVPQSWFLGIEGPIREIRNANSNLIPLCRECHDDVEAKSPVIRQAARERLRRRLTQQEIAFAISLRGQSWLDREYPA